MKPIENKLINSVTIIFYWVMAGLVILPFVYG
jgi:hypothetical protein